MNLGKRTGLLILPVILISYLLAALAVYELLRKSITRLEQSRLELRLGQLQSAFSTYSSFADAYLLSLIEGDSLGKYLRDSDNIYRGKILSNNLESAVRRLRQHNTQFASVAIIGPGNALQYYFENSADPFSTVRPEQLQLARQMYRNGKLQAWQHLFSTANNSLIIQGASIDSRTLAPPVPTQLDKTLQVIVAIEPTLFDQLLRETQQTYLAKIHYRNTKPAVPTTQLSASVQLRYGHYLLLTPDPGYLAAILSVTKQRLAFAVVTAALLTFLLLQLLIKRYITSPISRLDSQLSQVMDNKRQNIAWPKGDNEVGRLGQKFHRLYDQLSSAFLESRKQSMTDALTQLPNRTAFYEAALHNLKQAENKRAAISFIYIDLDNFKFVNDKYGHEVGDELLKAVAVRLTHLLELVHVKSAANQPVISRLSGDEFVVILPDHDNPAAQAVGERILNIFSRGYHFELGSFPVTVSLGMATYPQDGHTLSQLISNADLAMYQAKKSGKNKQATYSKVLAKKARQSKEIEESLKNIDYDTELSLQFMPIVDNRGNISGCEALLRWNSPTLGMVSPNEFIPIAETTGMFEQIDFWVMERAHKDFPALQKLLGDNFILSINISSAQLNSNHFAARLQALSEQYQVPTEQIELEITETFSTEAAPTAMNFFHTVREAGYKIAIDDFGTGYTSLMQMVDYPVNKIKLDKALIDRIANENKHPLLSALIDLCHIQGLHVTAEGVETAAQHRLLLAANCDFIQGYLLAKPMTFEDLTRWAADYRHQRRPRASLSAI